MDLLKKENWWIWLIIYFFGQGVGIYVLAFLVKVYDENAWYAKWQNWLIAGICCIFPLFVMVMIFTIKIKIETSKNLDVQGSEVYGNVYFWIVGLIVPIFGWIALVITSIYLDIAIIMALYRGNGEKYL